MRWSLFLLAALPLLAGCTVDTPAVSDGGQRVPIGISVSTHATRAGTKIQKSQFDEGETFRVFFASGATVSTTQFTTTNNIGATTVADGSTEAYFLEDATQAELYAYYPNTVTNETTNFTVEQDQTSAGGFKDSDLMWAHGTAYKSGTSAICPLTFTHKLSKIVVLVTAGEDVQKIYGVRIVGGYRTISISDGTTCELGSDYDNKNTRTDYITLWADANGDTAVVCAGMLPPQNISNEEFLEVTTDNGTYHAKLTKVLEPSHTYNMSMVVGAVEDGPDGTADTDNLVFTSDVLSIDAIAACTYTGLPLTPAITVRDKTKATDNILTEDTDYQLAFVNNVDVGTATVIAIGQGTYKGRVVSATFAINAGN